MAESFLELGIAQPLVEACIRIGWTKPTPIQHKSVESALKGNDIIGLAETGSGKTAAFALPIIHSLLQEQKRLFALIIAPTRELCYQISEQFEALGSLIGLTCTVLVGGIDVVSQAVQLAKRPHIIVGTPGRLVEHLQNTKGFSLSSIRFLVLDEADRILNMDFESEIDKILEVLPTKRQTFLFSATMTRKVEKLQRASLKNTVDRIEVSSKYQTVEKLNQFYLFIPHKYKDIYLIFILNDFAGNSIIIFCTTCVQVLTLTLMLRNLGLTAIPLNGKMPQEKRLAALSKFKSKQSQILVSTDVAARGLDIPHVDLVVNYSVPMQPKNYIHRVGRTARAGKGGNAITIVTQYDIELYQRVEHCIGRQLPLYENDESHVMILAERVAEAQRLAKMEMGSVDASGKKMKRKKDGEDDSEMFGLRKNFGKKKKRTK